MCSLDSHCLSSNMAAFIFNKQLFLHEGTPLHIPVSCPVEQYCSSGKHWQQPRRAPVLWRRPLGTACSTIKDDAVMWFLAVHNHKIASKSLTNSALPALPYLSCVWGFEFVLKPLSLQFGSVGLICTYNSLLKVNAGYIYTAFTPSLVAINHPFFYLFKMHRRTVFNTLINKGVDKIIIIIIDPFFIALF